MKFDITINGTLLLAFILAISSFILSVINADAMALFLGAIPYISGLALGRAYVGSVKKKVEK